MSGDFRILSRPLRLRWAGWEADTFNLQTAGWELSAEQDFYHDSMRIAFRHQRHDVRGITEALPFEYLEAVRSQRSDFGRLLPPLQVANMANKLWVRHTGIERLGFQPIDATPQIQPDWTMRSLDDLVHFAPAQASHQLILPHEESVPELLARIVDMQAGARLERFRREVREQRTIEQVEHPPLVHAQIITLQRRAA